MKLYRTNQGFSLLRGSFNNSKNLTLYAPISQNSPTKLPTNCLNVFDHFVGLATKGLSMPIQFRRSTSNTIFHQAKVHPFFKSITPELLKR